MPVWFPASRNGYYPLNIKRIAGLLLLTAIAVVIHGYHPYAEDSEIYLPGVLKILNPNLFPANAEFFGEHAAHTWYPNLIALSVRATHLPLPWVLFLWQLICILLLLVASWRLASALFEERAANERACWGAVALMAALLTLPVSGTALYIMDQYMNPRNLAAFASVFAVAETLRHRYVAGGFGLVFAALVHPLMASFAIAFCVWLLVLDRYRPGALGFAILLPFGITLEPPPPAYHEVALRQPYFYIQRWEWYEWLGLVAPVILFWMLARFARRRKMDNLELVSRAVVPFVLAATLAAIRTVDPTPVRGPGPARTATLSRPDLHAPDRDWRRFAGPVHTADTHLALAGAFRPPCLGNVSSAAAVVSCQRSGGVAMGSAAQPVGAGF